VSPCDHSFYARWRRQCGLAPSLHEITEPPPERLLQAIWQQQRLRRDHLRTLDGRAVRILHPGFLSVEGGPDFRGAVIQFADQTPVSGDIEVDLQSAGWHAHGHDKNPNFRSVILHVIWAASKRNVASGILPDVEPGILPGGKSVRSGASLESSKASIVTKPDPGGRMPPSTSGWKPDATLAVSYALDAPLHELATWLGGDTAPALPEEFRGRCSAPLRELGEGQLQELLRQAALVRFHGKAAQLAARARDAGWEQSLWEGLFRALGYKHNTWAMQRLAELRPRWADGAKSAPELQSRLLGIANLIPAELTRAQRDADDFIRQLWDHWWRERDAFVDCQLPRSLWRLHGIRPLNHPQRRLALAAHWLASENLVCALEQWGVAQLMATTKVGRVTPCAPLSKLPEHGAHGVTRPTTQLASALAKILQPKRDDFWTHHLTLRSARSTKPQLLLGEARVTDLAVNVILPWLFARAKEGQNAPLQSALETTYCAWPAAEDNSVLKLARQRLLGGTSRKFFHTAASQQGLLQITRDFCDHSNAICNQCRFPELVRAWGVNSVSEKTS